MIKIEDKHKFLELSEAIGVPYRTMVDIISKSDTINGAIGEITSEFGGNDKVGKELSAYYVGVLCMPFIARKIKLDSGCLERFKRNEIILDTDLILELADELAYSHRSYMCTDLFYCCREVQTPQKGGEQ